MGPPEVLRSGEMPSVSSTSGASSTPSRIDWRPWDEPSFRRYGTVVQPTPAAPTPGTSKSSLPKSKSATPQVAKTVRTPVPKSNPTTQKAQTENQAHKAQITHESNAVGCFFRSLGLAYSGLVPSPLQHAERQTRSVAYIISAAALATALALLRTTTLPAATGGWWGLYRAVLIVFNVLQTATFW